MKIVKFGHSCLLIEVFGKRILVDPGGWNKLPDDLRRVDVLLVTHEHPDHLNLDTIKRVVRENSGMRVLTNEGPGKVLRESGVKFELVEDGVIDTQSGIEIEVIEVAHALIYAGVPQVLNSAFFIAGKVLVTGDNFVEMSRQVEVLALPVAGPWLKLSDAIDYAKKVNPKFCFPVHDGMLKHVGSVYLVTKQILEQTGTQFEVLELGKEKSLKE